MWLHLSGEWEQQEDMIGDDDTGHPEYSNQDEEDHVKKRMVMKKKLPQKMNVTMTYDQLTREESEMCLLLLYRRPLNTVHGRC